MISTSSRHSLRMLVAAGLGLAGAGGLLAFAGCATEGSTEAPSPVVIDAGARADAAPEAGDGAIEAGRCAADDCVTYPKVCTAATLCRDVAVFEARADLLGLWASGPNDVWAAGTLGTVVHYDGTAWHSVPTGRKETFHSLWGQGPANVWLAATNDLVLHAQSSTLASGAWDVYDVYDGTNQACPVSGMWGSATKGLWGTLQCLEYSSVFPTPTNTVVHSSGWLADGGPSWEMEYQSPTIARATWDVHAVFGFGDEDVWVSGSGGVLFRRKPASTIAPDAGSDAGSTQIPAEWLEVNSRAATTINSIGGSGPNDVWLVGDLGLLRHWNGTTMESLALPPGMAPVNLQGVWVSSANDVWIVGDEALLLHYDGVHYTRIPVGGLGAVIPTFRKVWASDTTHQIWVVGDGILLGGKTSTLQ